MYSIMSVCSAVRGDRRVFNSGWWSGLTHQLAGTDKEYAKPSWLMIHPRHVGPDWNMSRSIGWIWYRHPSGRILASVDASTFYAAPLSGPKVVQNFGLWSSSFRMSCCCCPDKLYLHLLTLPPPPLPTAQQPATFDPDIRPCGPAVQGCVVIPVKTHVISFRSHVSWCRPGSPTLTLRKADSLLLARSLTLCFYFSPPKRNYYLF